MENSPGCGPGFPEPHEQFPDSRGASPQPGGDLNTETMQVLSGQQRRNRFILQWRPGPNRKADAKSFFSSFFFFFFGFCLSGDTDLLTAPGDHHRPSRIRLVPGTHAAQKAHR